MSLKKRIINRLQIINRKCGVALEKMNSKNNKPNIGRHCYGPLANPGEYDQIFIESIGSFCSFGYNTSIVQPHYLGVTTHQFLFSSWRYPEFDKLLPHDRQNQIFEEHIASHKTIIGNDVWTGRNVSIIAGVKIGDGAIIGTGAVVTHDVPDYAIVAGVPARIIRYRFTEDQIKRLKQIQWWNWDDKTIADRFDDFIDIESFIQKYSE